MGDPLAGAQAVAVEQRVTVNRPSRPCDSCRKRKSRCEMPDGASSCVLCQFHHRECTFQQTTRPRKRKITFPEDEEQEVMSMPWTASRHGSTSSATSAIRTVARIDCYENFKGPTLLRKTLGLQTHRHATFLGPSSDFEQSLLHSASLVSHDEITIGPVALRKVGSTDTFLQTLDESTLSHPEEISRLDAVETLVAPHGHELIRLYFRIVHPSFPILHKKVWLEKYNRTHREFSPPCLAFVYILALHWWTYSAELASLPKPNTTKLEEIALRALAEVVHRPKLSTIQAGLLLLQQPKGDSWALTTQLVGIGQEIGLHLDCSDWSIPTWEKGLRKRLAWALFMQDKWGALVHGRPSHINYEDWLVQPLTADDFPENAVDENDEDGSAEVEKGRLLFCEMVKLTEILSEILSTFYTLRAQREPRGGLREQLAIAKPIQIRLKEWFSQLPESVKGEDVKPRKLSSTGYLCLAYYATEITLHRHIIRVASDEADPELVEICRNAAKARLCSAVDFVSNLKPEHLQSFWYSPSYYNFSIISTFMVLLWSTATTTEEAAFYRQKLTTYRWILRVSSNASDVLERANAQLLLSTDGLTKLIPEEVVGRVDSPEESTTSHEHLDDPFDTPLATISSPQILQTLDVGGPFSPTAYQLGEMYPSFEYDIDFQGLGTANAV
ncbi:fungal-specific transcription factor domain-containing protein [Ilyonectria robusta]|uniref:fungal-specific transcription factor domain-containing protein n=1 Tax=Ilyonectria robusta TaxID=1079257 RepID=UPI001E8EBE9F|nr:fungal-specific transcription factor domain-containing protein [Ilyonectria robusta]KAH8680231.1 fungal-specific transcription factor domain-containing protein [Ilyonectria robusta]